jgi:hypothetical protein
MFSVAALERVSDKTQRALPRKKSLTLGETLP